MSHSHMMLNFCVAAVVTLASGGCRPSTTGSSRPVEDTPQSEETTSKGASRPEGDSPMPLTIQSSAFSNNEPIPVRFTADGEDIAPPLSWSGVPDNAKELGLIVDDPDAPGAQPWVHWVIYKIPVEVNTLAEGVATTGRPSKPAGS